MKRLSIIYVILLCLMLVITGCGQSVPADNNVNTSQENNNTTTQENNNVATQESNNTAEQENNSPTTENKNEPAQENSDSTSQDETPENRFDVLTLEERMERVLNDANEFTWGYDDGILSAKEAYVFSLVNRGYDNNFIDYINDTYIYEIPTSLDFEIKLVQLNDGGFKFELDGETYDFIYNTIFDENIKNQGVVEIYPFDPPILDTKLERIDEIYANTYRITGTYDDMMDTVRIEVTVEYGDFGMIIKSVERFYEQSNETVEENTNIQESTNVFRIRELVDVPSDKPTFEFLNPAYSEESIEYFTKYIFDIDGGFDSVRLVTQESIGLEEEYDLDLEGEDVTLVYYTMFPTDFSNDILIIKSAISGYEYEMQLNDAVERELYLFEEE